MAAKAQGQRGNTETGILIPCIREDPAQMESEKSGALFDGERELFLEPVVGGRLPTKRYEVGWL